MRLFVVVLLVLFTVTVRAGAKEKIVLGIARDASPRVQFGAHYLQQALMKLGYPVDVIPYKEQPQKEQLILIATSPDSAHLKKESFVINAKKKYITITGGDATGTLYGCFELADRIKEAGIVPQALVFSDAPEMVLRGQCIGLQKPYYLPGRNVYEYPYTPQTFPWFYNKKLWIQVLDSMAHNRMNSLYLWNGHPFASLVKLKEYPYAVEVDDATFKLNEEMYRFLTTEADKRGIWVIQMFYNIIVSKPFAEKNHLKTQERERPIIPVIADYTRKSIAAFVEKYPNVGLMVCLGEAMEGVGNDDIEWFTKTIIPGVQDGMKAAGIRKEPPIVLRAHDTDAPSVMKAALPLYKNLYTEAKFNGEALTDPRPRGEWAKLHQTLSHLGSVHIANVHILANLEPFRYSAPDFIQQSVIGMNEVLGAYGLHLYPEASYWDWPYTADSVQGGKRLLQIERDWIWYKAWSRYAWRSERDREEETVYWSRLMGNQFGLDKEKGKLILQSYEAMGQIAPKLLRRFGITDGNRQTLTLGMLMTQLINPYRYGLFTLLYEGESPEGEMLIEYADKEWHHQPHKGETPVQIAKEVRKHGDDAVAALKGLDASLTKNRAEFDRVKNDAACYRALAYHYAAKAEAALQVLRYKYSDNIEDLEQALPLLKQSLDWYQQLVTLTKSTYLYANSMQTQQRKIPLRGVNGTFKTWAEVLQPMQQEYDHFVKKLDSLKNTATAGTVKTAPLKNTEVKLQGSYEWFTIDSLNRVYKDTSLAIRACAPELAGIRGIKLLWKDQLTSPTSITFTNKKPVKVLVGFFQPQKAAFTRDTIYLKAPELETNALANDYGQADTKIANALVLPGMPQVNVHTYDFKAGVNTLKLEKGAVLILGFVEGGAPVPVYDAGLYESGNKKQVDWLFE
ncbi:hypothetical protein A8C56_03975 [Niabella ginsenosidivorans]|uniref:Beta-hexosaminidase bacterial type N-terminal domain-containing protein n=1 Tax=Niabella ginsenosidivorans TaxID=1176587 RepID=A0A1A9I121_9BACT|nr:hypothetical protein [Niabella ginsenosidivorans]ANH80254.1 hypothetical protein A8C56_03975 [Niabella ginsenosidivorans]